MKDKRIEYLCWFELTYIQYYLIITCYLQIGFELIV